MKRLFFILVAALMTASVMAEKSTSHAISDTIAHQTGKTGPNYDERNRVKSIAGVRFGETRRNAIGLFERRGTFVENVNNITYFSDFVLGNYTYSIAKFYFQYDSRKYDDVLAAVKFEKSFYTWQKDEAIKMYEGVIRDYKNRYTNYSILKDDDENRAMICGMYENDYLNGIFPPIYITFDLGTSRGGDKLYYVTITYYYNRMINVTDDI